MNKTTLLFLSIICPFLAFCQPDTAKVGLYITNLYDFDLDQESFTTEFWLWANYPNKLDPSVNFEASPEVKGSKSAIFSNYLLEESKGVKWVQKKAKAVIIQDWDVRNFPFDRQVLKINIEETDKDASELVYKADLANTKLDTNIVLNEWRVDSLKTESILAKYNTTYGDPDLSGSSEYGGIVTKIFITRTSSWNLLIKLTTGLYVSFLISLLVFTILPPDSESRIGLAVGGLFAAVGNKYIVEGVIPMSTQNTLIDSLHNITFAFILLIVAAVIYNTNLYVKGKTERSHRMDRMVLFGILTAFIVLNFVYIRSAYIQ